MLLSNCVPHYRMNHILHLWDMWNLQMLPEVSTLQSARHGELHSMSDAAGLEATSCHIALVLSLQHNHIKLEVNNQGKLSCLML